MTEKIHTKEEIQKHLASLPDDITKLLYSPDMGALIQRIGGKHQLHIDQTGLLEAETAEVMLGFTETKDYPQKLMEGLRIDRLKADAIAQDINDQLFVKIRESMKKVYEQQKIENEKPKITPPSVAPPPAPQVKLTPPPTAVTPADLALSQKTVSVPPKPVASGELLASSKSPTPNQPVTKPEPPPSTNSGQAKPAPYKADPYREPPE